MVGKGSQLYASSHNHEKSEGGRDLKGVDNAVLKPYAKGLLREATVVYPKER